MYQFCDVVYFLQCRKLEFEFFFFQAQITKCQYNLLLLSLTLSLHFLSEK